MVLQQMQYGHCGTYSTHNFYSLKIFIINCSLFEVLAFLVMLLDASDGDQKLTLKSCYNVFKIFSIFSNNI